MGSPVISATMSITSRSSNIGMTCIWGLGEVFFYLGHPLLNLCLASAPSPWWCRCWLQSCTYLENSSPNPPGIAILYVQKFPVFRVLVRLSTWYHINKSSMVKALRQIYLN